MGFNDIQNLELGPLYGFIVNMLDSTVGGGTVPIPVGGGTPQDYIECEMGLSEGGVTLTLEQENAELMADQYGTNVLDYVIIKRQATVTYPMAENLHDTFVKIVPNYNETTPTTGGNAYDVGISIGTSTRDFAQPDGSTSIGFVGVMVKGGVISTDDQDQICIPLVAVTSGWEVSYSRDNQRIREVVLSGMFDPQFPSVVIFGNWGGYIWDILNP